jgi:molybdopterin converting factor small subunit
LRITLKCYATLKPFEPEGEFDIQEGDTPAKIMERLGMNPDEVKIIFKNGIGIEADQVLEDGDRVGFFPPVGGG